MEKKWLVRALALTVCAVLAVGAVLIVNGAGKNREARNRAAQEETARNQEMEALQTQIADLLKEQETMAASLASSEQECSALRNNLTATQIAFADVDAKREALELENEALTAQAAQAQAEANGLRESLTASQTSLETVRKEKEALSAQAAEAQAEAAGLRENLTATQTALETVQKEKEALTAQAGEAQAEAAGLRESLTAAQTALEAVQKEKEALTAQVDALMAEALENAAKAQAREGIAALVSGRVFLLSMPDGTEAAHRVRLLEKGCQVILLAEEEKGGVRWYRVLAEEQEGYLAAAYVTLP